MTIGDDPLVVALTSFCGTSPSGEEFFVRAGQRFRASDYVVRTWSTYFHPAESSDGELAAASRALGERS